LEALAKTLRGHKYHVDATAFNSESVLWAWNRLFDVQEWINTQSKEETDEAFDRMAEKSFKEMTSLLENRKQGTNSNREPALFTDITSLS
jgi:hypothetical protein